MLTVYLYLAASGYSIEIANSAGGPWSPAATVTANKDGKQLVANLTGGPALVNVAVTNSKDENGKLHVLHEINFGKTAIIPRGSNARYIRLLLTKLGTQWGISIWRFEIYGVV